MILIQLPRSYVPLIHFVWYVAIFLGHPDWYVAIFVGHPDWYVSIFVGHPVWYIAIYLTDLLETTRNEVNNFNRDDEI